jgi:hypothetical protein
MPTTHSTAIGVLEAAFDSENENLLVEELRKVSSQRSRREARIALVTRILEQTGSPRVRNAAALALADMRARGATNKLIDVLKRDDTKVYRGTLLYALEQLDATLPISLLVDIVMEDSYEAREEALYFIASGKFDCDEDPGHLRRKLVSALTSADEERSHAINSALKYLIKNGSPLQEKYDLGKETKKLMKTDTLILSLIPAPDDPKRPAREYQSELHEFYNSLRAAAIEASARMRFRDATGAGASFLGDFLIPLAQAVGPTLGVILMAWLKGRSGRRVRLKFDGVEAEGRTPEDVETLLKRAAEFRNSKSKPDGAA